MILTYQTDRRWGSGHYVVYDTGRCVGRVSTDADGGWSAYPEPLYPTEGTPLPEAYAHRMTRRSDAGKLLAAVADVSRETSKGAT